MICCCCASLLFFLNEQVMDLTRSALVHPAKLISSMAPVLLEHVFNLRRVSGSRTFVTLFGLFCTYLLDG